MSIKFRHSCGKKISCPDELVGRSVRCPKCGEPARVPNDLGDHTSTLDDEGQPAPEPEMGQIADHESCELRPGGQATVVRTTMGDVRKGLLNGDVKADDLLRIPNATSWAQVRSYSELAAELGDAPSRVGGISFSPSEPAPAEDEAYDFSAPEPEQAADVLGNSVCAHHASRPAEYFCTRCEQAMCSECMNKIQGEILCEECSDRLLADAEAQPSDPWGMPNESLALAAPSAADIDLSPDRVKLANRAMVTELALACVLCWLGIGWLYFGRALTGLLLLVSYFCLVIAELSVFLTGPLRPPPWDTFLKWGIPFMLLQNALVGVISAASLSQAAKRSSN